MFTPKIKKAPLKITHLSDPLFSGGGITAQREERKY